MSADPRGDLRWGTTGNLLATTAARLPDVEAIVDGELRLTYRELDAAATEAAFGFLAAGVQPGERVAIWAPNSALWVVAALGVHRAGGVLVPLNTRFVGDEAAFILRKAGVRVLVTVTDFLDRDYVHLLDGADALGGLERVVVMSGKIPAGTQSWDQFLAAGAAADSLPTVQPDDLSDVLFTSGTTGRPKGAMCTHAQTLRAYAVWAQVVGLREGDRYLVINPFFHGFGYKAGWLAAIMVGATIIPQRVLDVPELLDVIRRERVTVLPGTPTLYQTMLEHPRYSRDGTASLRLAVTGAATVPPALLQRIKAELGFETIVTGYGLTESSAIVSMCRYDDDPEVVATTVGHPLPGLEVRIADGEILVRGYTVMQGYLDDPEQTAAVIDADGWLHTGDIGVLDDDGRLRITDRLKDMVIVGGFNVYPAEVERVLAEHPTIAQVAVIGIPDGRLGEVPAAFVVPRTGTAATGDEIMNWARDKLANYKLPRKVWVVDSLPLNASGKVLKTVLRERAGSDDPVRA